MCSLPVEVDRYVARRHKTPKARFPVKNRPIYEAPLRQRGDNTVWNDDDVTTQWTVPSKRTPKGNPV